MNPEHPLGYCPICGHPGQHRNGDIDMCSVGHSYRGIDAITDRNQAASLTIGRGSRTAAEVVAAGPLKIGVIGGGVLGQAIARGWLEWSEGVRIFDTDKARATHSREDAALGVKVCYLCLPTPARADNGHCDTSILDEFFSWLNQQPPELWSCDKKKYAPIYVIRSTVPTGYTQGIQNLMPGLRLLHSPEFLTARCSLVDFQTPARNIIGVPKTSKPLIDQNGWAAADVLEAFYATRFPGVPILKMTSTESELTKLLVNGFFATKVTYFNAARALCEATGCDWESVLEGVMSDGRIAHAHTRVPGPDGRPGYGGLCLPKDLLNLITVAGQNQCLAVASLLAAVHIFNTTIRSEHDQSLPQPGKQPAEPLKSASGG